MAPTPQEMAERHARGLARLQEITLAACEVLYGRLEAAETPEATATVALSLQRMTRACRQAMLVEAKLMREARALTREDEALAVTAAAKTEAEAYRARKARARELARGIVAEACERAEDVAPLMREVEVSLDFFLQNPAFAGQDLETLVGALWEDLLMQVDDVFLKTPPPRDDFPPPPDSS